MADDCALISKQSLTWAKVVSAPQAPKEPHQTRSCVHGGSQCTHAESLGSGKAGRVQCYKVSKCMVHPRVTHTSHFSLHPFIAQHLWGHPFCSSGTSFMHSSHQSKLQMMRVAHGFTEMAHCTALLISGHPLTCSTFEVSSFSPHAPSLFLGIPLAGLAHILPLPPSLVLF